MPSAIAIRMYCVNLFDIFLPPKVPAALILADSGTDATRFQTSVRLPQSSHCGMSARRLASCAANVGSRPPQPRPAAPRIETSREGNAMNDTVNRQVLLVEKPSGKLGPEHFKMSKAAIPEPKDGEALERVRYISLDAANRAWMHGATYRAAVEANTVMAGGGIAEVVSPKSPSLAPGAIVFGDTGWQDYAPVPAKPLAKMPKIEPMTHRLSVYGIAGLTAYFGLLDVGKAKAGETVVVSAA